MTNSARKRTRSPPGTLPRKNGRRHPSPPLTVSRPELLVKGSDRHFRRLVHSFFGFLSRHEAIRRGHAARIGLLGVEYSTLISIRHLDAEEGDVNVNRVAEHLHLSGAFVTNITNKLSSAASSINPSIRPTAGASSCKSRKRPMRYWRSSRRCSGKSTTPSSAASARPNFCNCSVMVERLIASSEDAVRLQAYLANSPAAKIFAHPRLPSSRRA